MHCSAETMNLGRESLVTLRKKWILSTIVYGHWTQGISFLSEICHDLLGLGVEHKTATGAAMFITSRLYVFSLLEIKPMSVGSSVLSSCLTVKIMDRVNTEEGST